MASPTASSSRPGSTLVSGSRLPEVQPSRKAGQEPWAKRVVTAWARRLKNNSLIFPTVVKGFRALQRVGINVTPNHFYWPVPDLAELENREWPIYPAPPGCDFRLREQVEMAREFARRYMPEIGWNSKPTPDAYHYQNGYFECCDAEVAYSMVRHWKPRRIIEIGSGYSTRVMVSALRANLENHGIVGELITVDPNPERLPENSLGDLVTVIAEPVQRLDTNFFDILREDDVLFIDSSHVAVVGSDVVREYLQILPRLNPGVLVHAHDIFLPSDYPRDAVLSSFWFWSEQYLLQAFLAFNPEFEVLWSASAMQLSHARTLEQCFPNWKYSYREMPADKRRFIPTVDGDRVWPSSFWMRRVSR